jgi:hypothetical protein
MLVATSPALAWGPKAHRVIAELARGPMLSAQARSAIIRILGDDDLAAVATWADDVRPGNDLANTEESRRLLKGFPNHADWHYISFPLGVMSAPQTEKCRGKDEALTAIAHMVEALEHPEKPGAVLTHRRALQWLVHLVADIHNPMHASTCFYAPRGSSFRVVTDPVEALSATRGEGGNEIAIGGAWKLHAFWDGPMVDVILPNAGKPGLSSHLGRKCPAEPMPPMDPRSKPEVKWAIEAVGVAREAYSLVNATSIVRDGRGIRVSAYVPGDYAAANKQRSETQILRAAQRLAGLLNGMKWGGPPP